MDSYHNRVLIVGAGPVGMASALALNRAGIEVTVFDKEDGPVRDQRAASVHPTTLEMLDAYGVADIIIPNGLISEKYQYRDRQTSEIVAEFNLQDMKDEFKFPFVLQYEQYKFTRDIAAQYANESDFAVKFAHEVFEVNQFDDHVELVVEGPNGIERYKGAYVIGADGGRSIVRRTAGIAFEGFTYEENFVKIATKFDFQSIWPDLVYRNYLSDPDEWCNLFKVRGESESGLWRAIFPTRKDESPERSVSVEGLQERMHKFFPKEGDYEIVYANVYGVNQRVAATFRQGRILLAGDSAHVNNPIGGMGMNGGIHDAINLAEKLVEVMNNKADDSLLDKYSRQRRHAAVTFVQAQTIANKKLLEEKDPEIRNKKLDEMRKISEDPELSKQFMRRASLKESLISASEID